MKPLSAQLADLSVRAKNAETPLLRLRRKLMTSLSRSSSRHALTLIQLSPGWIGTSSLPAITSPAFRGTSLKAKVAADKTAWDAKIAQIKHDVSAGLAEDYAEQLEWEASFAIAYAEAAIEEAKAAALDAVAARIQAEKAKAA